MNSSGTPKSCSRNFWIAACRSSRFLPFTRSWSPCTWCWTPFRPSPLMNFPISRALSSLIPTWIDDLLAGAPLGRLFDLAVVDRLQRHLALHEFLLEHLGDSLQPLLRCRLQLDRVVALLQRHHAVGALEVESVRELAVRLIDRVLDLLDVDLGHHVEARHDSHSFASPTEARLVRTLARLPRLANRGSARPHTCTAPSPRQPRLGSSAHLHGSLASPTEARLVRTLARLPRLANRGSARPHTVAGR